MHVRLRPGSIYTQNAAWKLNCGRLVSIGDTFAKGV